MTLHRRIVIKRRPSAAYADGAADIAQRFGITIKALRHYEKAGLIRPVRDRQGWRSYGQVECERLHLILLLRRFGLSIARIGEILADGAPDLAMVLNVQERALGDQRGRIDEALALIARAKARIAAGEALDPPALAELARMEPLCWRWPVELDEAAARFFSPEHQVQLSRTAPAQTADWSAVLEELDRLDGTPPDSPAARAVGQRATALIAAMTGGDGALHGALTQFWRAGFGDPALAPALPMTEAQWLWLGAAMAAQAEDAA